MHEEALPPPDLHPTYLAAHPYPPTLNLAVELLDRHVMEGRGHQPALRTPTEILTYAALGRYVNQVGHVLRGLDVERGDRVLLRLPNGLAYVAAWLAIQKIGAVAVGTIPMLRTRELTHVLTDCQPRVAVVSESLMDALSRARELSAAPTRFAVSTDSSSAGPIVPASGQTAADSGWQVGDIVFEAAVHAASDVLAPEPVGRHDLALIAYTSGSTGLAKGTCHTPADVLASADGYAAHILEVRPSDVFGGHPTLSFTFGLGGLLIFPLRAGASTVLSPTPDLDTMLAAAERGRVTILFCAATTYRLLLNQPDFERRYDLSSLRLCVSAGETLPAPVYERWKARTGLDILDGLGSTEMFHIFVSSRMGQIKPGATGVPVPGYEARVVDEQMQSLPDGTPGLLAVRGPSGCKYWRNRDRQREYVRDGWNVPGDIYVRDQDGYYWYQCRQDDIIVSAGYNITPHELEQVIAEHPAVAEVAVIGVPDAIRGAVPKAFIVLQSAAQASEALVDAIKAFVKQEIAPYKYPRQIAFVDALPKTETGKIRRAALREGSASADQ